MREVIQMQIWQFSLIYLLLILVLAVMKKSQIKQTKLLLVASLRMTVQLVLAGLILTYIFQNPHPVFIFAYVIAMMTFSIHRILSKNKEINKRFKIYVALSLVISGLGVTIYFIVAVVGESLLNPQYVIPIAGMLMGNTMNGVSLGIKSFNDSLKGQRGRVESLLNFGVSPDKILLPFVNQALETALLPTMNSMLGMGIIALPGMMTGQILSGTLPTTAILYQIAIMIAITTVVCLAVFASLYLGYKTLYNDRNQLVV